MLDGLNNLYKNVLIQIRKKIVKIRFTNEVLSEYLVYSEINLEMALDRGGHIKNLEIRFIAVFA